MKLKKLHQAFKSAFGGFGHLSQRQKNEALIEAVSMHQTKRVAALIDAGVKINTMAGLPLCIAASQNDPDMIDVLVKRGKADVAHDHQKALRVAIQEGKGNAFDSLIKHGANLDKALTYVQTKGNADDRRRAQYWYHAPTMIR